MLELFKVPQYPMYAVTKCGKVYSYYTNKFMKIKCKRGPYYVVNITVKPSPNKVQRSHDVHKLVLWAFKGARPEGKEAAHLDNNPENNNIDNLDWVSHRENIKHQVEKEAGRYSKPRIHHGYDVRISCVMERLNGASYNYLVEKYGVSRRAIERWVAEAKNLKPEVSK